MLKIPCWCDDLYFIWLATLRDGDMSCNLVNLPGDCQGTWIQYSVKWKYFLMSLFARLKSIQMQISLICVHISGARKIAFTEIFLSLGFRNHKIKTVSGWCGMEEDTLKFSFLTKTTYSESARIKKNTKLLRITSHETSSTNKATTTSPASPAPGSLRTESLNTRPRASTRDLSWNILHKS